MDIATPDAQIRRERSFECERIGPLPEVSAPRSPADGKQAFVFENTRCLLHRGDPYIQQLCDFR
jgi:hypothetical protein